MIRNKWILILGLLGAALLLTGCGVDRAGVDVRAVDPEGWWQTIMVWPLARTLISIRDWLLLQNVPYAWGFAIIVFTLFIRIVLLPLTYVQIKGMQGQKGLQPRLQELQKKYGKDRQRLMREQRKMYEEEGINPLSGCLPLLLLVVQMPILFGLYSALVVLGGELTDSRFFWIPDLGFPEFTGGMGWIMELFQTGNYGRLLAYLALPSFLMATQYIMTKYMNPTATDASSPQASTMKSMSTIMTIMFGFFSLQVPAGLSLYWVTGNLLQMGQQYLMGRLAESKKGKPESPKTQGDGGTWRSLPPATQEVTEGPAIIEPGISPATPSRRRRKKRRRKP